MSAKRLKRSALPSMTGLRGERAAVAQPEDGAAVGDHGDQVAARRVVEGRRRVARDLEDRLGDARRVGQGQVPLGEGGLGRDDLDLAGPAVPVVFERGITIDHVDGPQSRSPRHSTRVPAGVPPPALVPPGWCQSCGPAWSFDGPMWQLRGQIWLFRGDDWSALSGRLGGNGAGYWVRFRKDRGWWRSGVVLVERLRLLVLIGTTRETGMAGEPASPGWRAEARPSPRPGRGPTEGIGEISLSRPSPRPLSPAGRGSKTGDAERIVPTRVAGRGPRMWLSG